MYTCFQCGSESMVKTLLPGGDYELVCRKCGYKEGPCKPDEGRSVV
jgi:DNA-directed RNA polymerase subunit RPC12/RpoP